MIRFLSDGIYLTFASGEPFRLLAWYGLILMSGAVAGAWLAAREVKRRGGNPDVVLDLMISLLVGGVIGARLWHVFTPPPSSIEQGYTTVYYLTPWRGHWRRHRALLLHAQTQTQFCRVG